MPFLAALIITTICIAGSAAFFSIYGLAHTFSGAFWSVVFMGASLEMGKLVSASFLYRYWKKIGKFLKTYLISAIAVLMVITSIGIFAFLSAAYQIDTLEYKGVETQLVSLKNEKDELTKRKEEIDKQISQLPPNYVTARQRLMRTFGPELKHINERLPVITAEIQKLTTQKVTVQAHTGPITYIASTFGIPVDDATKWIAILLIIVFDPLAVALTIAANVVIRHKAEQSGNFLSQLEDKQPVVNPLSEPTKIEPSPSTDPTKIEDGMLTELKRKKEITDQVRSNTLPQS